MKTLTIFLIVLLFSNLTFADPIPGERDPLPLPGCKVQRKTYFVNAKYRGASDGSSQAPFISFSQALLAATNSKVCNLEIRVADGTYAETLNIDRNTNIIAIASKAVIAGSITNISGSTLKLNGIQINSATGVGIAQSGGMLEMNNSSILWTKLSRITKGFSGTGLMLSRSAKAILNTVQISANNNRGIYITDQGSVLWANHLIVLRNGNQGIEVTNGAKAFLNDIRVEENIKAGIFISENARVNIQYAVIRFSKFVPPDYWGDNIVVTTNAVLDIFNFNTSGADSVGLTFDNAFVTASLGQVENNNIGIVYLHTTYNIQDCIGDNVAFIGNTTRFGVNIPPKSTCPAVDDDCMRQRQCARVPWEMP